MFPEHIKRSQQLETYFYIPLFLDARFLFKYDKYEHNAA